MKNNLLYLLFFLLPFYGFAQSVEILEKSDVKDLKKQKDFDYLHVKDDTTKMFIFVGTIKASGNYNIARLYESIMLEANKLGANCFRLVDYNEESKKSSLTLNVYFASTLVLVENELFKERNVVYIFGNDKDDDGKTSFKLNGKKAEVGNKEYLRIENPSGNQVKVSKGGFTGASVQITGESNKSATYLTLSGLGVAPSGGYYSGGYSGSGVAYGGVGAGISISTGKINYMNPGLANILLQIWKKEE